MSMLLVHELHEARDRVLLLCQKLEAASKQELPAYQTFLADEIGLLNKALEDARIPEYYRVAIVGRFKVGKSSFINRLAQEKFLAGVKELPETAAISIFRYAEKAYAEIEIISKEHWEELRLLHAENPESIDTKRYANYVKFSGGSQQLNLAIIENEWIKDGGYIHTINATSWTSAEAKKKFRNEVQKFTSSQQPHHCFVKKITVYAPIPLLRDHIELIDTPGLIDTEGFRVHLTEELVREVDAILFLTSSGASYDQNDKDFLKRQLRQRQLKHLQIIVTQADTTYENVVKHAENEEEEIPSYEDFSNRQITRVKNEVAETCLELLGQNQVTDDDANYFMDQLDNVPIHLTSTIYHDKGDVERGGIETVRDKLYKVLSTSHRFEQSRRILTEQLNSSLIRLRDRFSERLNAIESEYDPEKVKNEIEAIRSALGESLDFFAEEARKLVELLSQRQEGSFKELPLVLDNACLRAKEVLSENEVIDIGKHWKTRRVGNWGFLRDLQTRIADRIFPVVELRLNEFCSHFDGFMKNLADRLQALQIAVRKLEAKHRLSGLKPMAIAEAQRPVFDELEKRFVLLREGQRDSIVNRLEDFVTAEFSAKLIDARNSVSEVVGGGTTVRQGREVQNFYNEVKRLLTEALRTHLDTRIHEFAEAIAANAKSVAPRIREATLAMIEQRIQAIESTLAIASKEEKIRVLAYLQEMRGITMNFAAEPITPTSDKVKKETSNSPDNIKIDEESNALSPNHYEIQDGVTGNTYERIFRPYLDDADIIEIEDPYIRKIYQVENFARFCALAIRLGKVKEIRLISGKSFGEDLDDADSRLETLRRDLKSRDIVFSFRRDEKIHDREIRLNNGWVIKVGRGLDIYYPPENWASLEAADFSLRRCKQTKIEVIMRN